MKISKPTNRWVLNGVLMLGILITQTIFGQDLNPGDASSNTNGNTYTNTYFPDFNPSPVITYPTNTTLKWTLTMPSYPLQAQLSMAPDGTLYVPVATLYTSLQSLWAINPSLVDTGDPNYPYPDDFTNWVFGSGNGQAQPTPAINRDGTVYTFLYSYDQDTYQWTRRLDALSPSKTNAVVLWTFATTDQPGQIAVDNDGTVYTAFGNYICALTNAPDYTNAWQIYYNYGGSLYPATFNFTNVWLKWMNYDTNNLQRFGTFNNECIPVVSSNTIYCHTLDGTLYAISTTNGGILWTVPNSGGLNPLDNSPSSPAIGVDGTVYYGQGTNFYAVNPNAAVDTNEIMTPQWVYHGNTPETFAYSPVIGNGGTVYVETLQLNVTNRIFAFNPATGVPNWITPVGSGTVYYGNYWKAGSLAIAADGEIYVAEADGSLWSLDPNGNINWSFQTEDGLALSSPLIGPDGSIYVMGQNGGESPGIVYAFAGVSPIACSAWPEDGRNARRTSAVAYANASSPIMTTNGFSFTITGLTNAPACGCATFDFVTWTNLGQTVLTGGITNFVDINSTNYPYRFYRAYSQ